MGETLKIDVSEVLKAKMPGKYRYIPRFVVKWLERIIHQDELNALLLKNGDKKGVDFADVVLKDLEITTEVIGKNNLPPDGSGRYIFASNHPLGGLDGISPVALMGRHYNRHLKFIVNDMLMQVTPFRSIFLPANKVGRQSREVAREINEAMSGTEQIATFPAGLCSRRQSGGNVCDLKWTKGFIHKSIEYRRDIVPIYFDGLNSDFFYRMARLRERLGIKFNVEMILLPGEVFKNRGKKFTIYIGKPIKWETLTSDGRSPLEIAQGIKEVVYNLKTNNS